MGFSVLRTWPIFGSVFQFLLLKIAVFRFWCLVQSEGFLQFSLWFSVFVNALCSGFSGFAKEGTLTVGGMHDKPSLKAHVIWVVTAPKQPGEGTWIIFAGYVPLASQNPTLL